MNYEQLQQQILADSHRPDLASRVPYFVQQAEAMIARELRSAEQIRVVTLTDAHRVEGGVYELPADFLEGRTLQASSGARTRELQQVSFAELTTMPASAGVFYYAIIGATLEFSGVPAEGAEFRLIYFARLAPLADAADTNLLLQQHPDLYVQGALFHLFRVTQDMELAQASVDVFTHAVETLNEQAGRQLGSPRVNGAYNFGPAARFGGY